MLVTAARFQADRGDRTSRQSSEQLSPAGCVVGDAKNSPTGSDCYVQTIDGNIDPDIVRLAQLRTPSLLMRARALATVRVWKIWLESRARPRSDSQDAHGLPVVAGRLVTEPPSSARGAASCHGVATGTSLDAGLMEKIASSANLQRMLVFKHTRRAASGPSCPRPKRGSSTSQSRRSPR
jgi:hypothetical protein